MMLNADVVSATFTTCLWQEDENPDKRVRTTDGIAGNVSFHADRLESCRPLIESLLDELPAQFRETAGGGSFLNACLDRHGNQWTGLQVQMEQLFQLGIGIGRVRSLFSRAARGALPGGMPYYLILDAPTPAA